MRFLTPLLASTLMAGTCAAQDASRDVMVVFDMSGSMWGQVGGVAKVEIARDAFGELITDWTANDTSAGLIAYGHRRRGDCTDIEILAQPGEGADIASLIAPLQPRGKTPLSDAVKQAADVLRFTEEKATVVLLSDGVETCEADPCAVGAELEALGLDFTAHVIGFDIAEGDKAQLQCLASATGGQYFDAADAGSLSDAMKGVAQATAVTIPAFEPAQDYQDVTIRVRMNNRTIALPEQVTIYGNDMELGTLTKDAVVVPGLPAQLEFGPITLRVEGDGVSGEMVVDVTDQTEMIDLELKSDAADYVIWREGQLPVLEGGKDHIIMLKNTTGVDRAGFYRGFLYPIGSSDPADAIKTGNIPPTAGIYTPIRVPSPAEAGDYEFVPTGTDGTEYARIPLSFADAIDPIWLGPREVAPGEVIDAAWAGSSNRRDRMNFMLDGRRVSSVPVEGMATENGFKLTAPDQPGLYELVFASDFENSLGSKTTTLGQIAVGVPLPRAERNPDFDGLEEESEAMGGEESPTEPVGDLHGDWKLIYQNTRGTVSLLRFQLSHGQDELSSTGGSVIEDAANWGFGEEGSFGEVTLTKRADGGLTMTIVNDGTSTDYVMTPGEFGWTTSHTVQGGNIISILLVKADDFAAVEAAADSAPRTIQIVALTEQGEQVTGPVTWVLQRPDTDAPETFTTSDNLFYEQSRPPGPYSAVATAGDLTGRHSMTFGRGYSEGEVVIMKPTDEGADLALSVDYVCSAGEDCNMIMTLGGIKFELPVGWGAERPIRIGYKMAMFNMTTNTPTGPFFATLNQPQRSADLGPCFQLVAGTFCHDATDDPALLADVDLLKQTFSFREFGAAITNDRFEELVEKFSGATK